LKSQTQKKTSTIKPHKSQFTFSIMKFDLCIVTAVALLAGQVFGEKVAGGLRSKTKVRVRLYHVFAVVSFPL
jgi:hypothetical protein